MSPINSARCSRASRCTRVSNGGRSCAVDSCCRVLRCCRMKSHLGSLYCGRGRGGVCPGCASFDSVLGGGGGDDCVLRGGGGGGVDCLGLVNPAQPGGCPLG